MIIHAPIPISSNINPLAWIVAIVFTVIVHLVFFMGYHRSPKALETTGNEHAKSIEIGLKKILLPPPPPPAKPKAVVQPLSPPKRKPLTKAKQKEKSIVKPKPIAIPKPVVEEPKPIIEELESIVEELEPIVEELEPVVKEPELVKEIVIETEPSESTAEENVTEAKTEITKDHKVKESNGQQAAVNAKTSEASFTSNGNPAVKVAYETSLAAWLTRYKRYPSSAKRRRQEDLIELEFTIDKQGKLLSQRIINKSPYNSLNKAVINMIKKASPLPPVPEDIQGSKATFTFIIPIAFELN